MLQIRELTEAEREAYDEMNAAVMETCYASHRMPTSEEVELRIGNIRSN